ncbi:sugar ABC transporter ATP-binding protein [Rhodobium gokarnense]|uniref:Simple sugar transport system ATP-binding protein n=1 Tax=Rhodobium gokarnense TaxID=364296 RepID=A0ABT3HF28_9HYPH|nr:simple sugar transport system ATP-binding protein [Rhodobium gokarnense]
MDSSATSPLMPEGSASTVGATPFLELSGIHKRFAGVHALRGVSTTIEAGQIYHLMGENGSGKSTLIKIISGAQPADEGSILIDGKEVTSLTPLGALSAGIETVYQDLSLLPNLTVTENISLSQQLVEAKGRLSSQIDRARLDATAVKALEAVGLPTDPAFRSLLVEELPIATRQLVAIARVIAVKAKLVIMDEPTSALTKREVDNLIEVVGQLRESGVAVLFVTHKLDESKSIGGRFIVLRDGELVKEGDIKDHEKDELSFWMTGKRLDASRYRRADIGAPGLLEVKDLRRRRDFADVSFSLAKGEILGIAGLLDSGRNELARALAGVTPADGGEIRVDGKAVALRQPVDAIDAGIGYVPEDRLSEGLFLEKPISANIVVQILDRIKNRLGMIDAGESRKLSEAIAEQLHIVAADLKNPVQSLSGGNQQRVLIGRGLATQPKLFVLHGPTVGVDVGSKDTIFRIIQKLAGEGMGVIIVSDDLPELLQNCDRIMVMRKGRIAETFDAERVDEDMLYHALASEKAPEAGS